MKSRILKIVAIINVLILCLTFSSNVSLAVVNEYKELEYTEAYKKWLNLSDEERKNTIEPNNKYKIDFETKDIYKIDNVLKTSKMLKASYLPRYDLRTVIGENVKVRNQGATSLCWAFSSLANLETSLAMQDKKNNAVAKEYDFSEQHLAYATTREAFLNYAINERGYNKSTIDGGTYLMSTAYLTNGIGVVDEKDMPFDEESIKQKIDINEIKNKKVATTVVDTKLFNSPTTEQEKEELMQEMKQYIVTQGGISAQIYGAQLNSECYNNETAAIYADDENKYPINHGVIIIGWDDNYSKDNFNENKKPSKNGAWIIKNSWGEGEQIISLTELKELLYSKNQAYFNENNIYNASQIPDEFVLEYSKDALKEDFGRENIIIKDGYIYAKIGDEGCMYISYEDVNVLSGLFAIENAKNYVDYDNIYQYDYLGSNNAFGFSMNSSNNKVYMANVFETKNKGKEEITKIAVNTIVPLNNCKVLVNPNSSSKNYSDLQRVNLKEGEYEDITPGYHTIEFENPIKINGDSFVIVLEFNIKNIENYTYFPVLQNSALSGYIGIDIQQGRSFFTNYDSLILGNWADFADKSVVLPMKAFTNNIGNAAITLTGLEITKAPDKTVYEEGENFDPEGMVVKATYSDESKKEVTDYVVTNGNNLKENQESVTITYTEKNITKTAIQNITVNKKQEEKVTLTGLEIKTIPNKTVYEEGEDFDKEGMVVNAIYSDESKKEVTNYVVTNGTNLKLGQTSVTISYTEDGVTKTTTQSITVNKKQEEITLTKIEITRAPNKIVYEEGENFDKTGMVVKATYSDESKKEVTNYTVTNGTNLKLGQTSVTISYTEDGVTKTTTQSITVNKIKVVLTKIEITKAPNKVVYEEGENFDKTGMVVKATYSDESKKEVTNYIVTNGTNLKLGQTSVTISYTEDGVTKTTTQSITVNKKQEEITLTKIEITKAPNKVVYEEGENFDKEGMVVKATYSDESKKEVTNYIVTNGTNLKLGQTSVTITYTEGEVTKLATQNITVNKKQEVVEEKVLTKIEITKAPNKVVYEEGENFDPEGMIVKATYSDESKKEITNYNIVDGNNLKENQKNVTVTYTEGGVTKTVTQSITVNKIKVVLTKIEITKAPNKIVYEEEENFDKEGMVVKATYSDESKKEITNYSITNGTNLELGQTEVTISYTEDGVTKEAKQSITVNKKQEEIVLTKIEVKTIPNKTTYEEGENFDKDGMVVNAVYSDGSKKEVTNYTITNGTNLKLGQTEVTITYTEGKITKETKQSITVNAKEKEHPTPSDFTSAKSDITSVKSYMYVNKNKEDYVLMNVELENIKLGDANSNRKFYYFISDEKGEILYNIDIIKAWKEFSLKDNTSASISIDTRNLKYANNIAEKSNLYIYIKEVTTLGEESITTMNMVELKNKATIEVYVDDVKKDNNNQPNSNPSTEPEKDNTTATGTIPQTGSKIGGIALTIIAFIGIAAFSYYKYKNLKNLNL